MRLLRLLLKTASGRTSMQNHWFLPIQIESTIELLGTHNTFEGISAEVPDVAKANYAAFRGLRVNLQSKQNNVNVQNPFSNPKNVGEAT